MNSSSPSNSTFEFHRRQSWWLLTFVLALSACYEAAHLYRGWVPHDEGCLTDSALRVMHGQLPHRDYIEIYTGGLAYLDAFAFKILGLRFVSLRIVLFLFFLIWVAAIFRTATNFASGWIAAAVTLLAVVASVPIYSAAMPSWYNLFFATFGVAALLRFTSSPSWQWLFACGLCAGFSSLAKVSGLYFLAAAILFCVYWEQAEPAESVTPSARGRSVYSLFLIAALLLSVLADFRIIHANAKAGDYLHFLFPAAALCAFLISRELRVTRSNSVFRIARMTRLITPLVAGFACPVVIFLVPYVRSHSLHSVAVGVFVLPFQRVAIATSHALSLKTLPTAGIFSLPLAMARWSFGRLRKWLVAGMIALSVALVVASRFISLIYRFTWDGFAWIIPVVALFGFVYLWSAQRRRETAGRKEAMIFALLCTAVMCSLIQFPFARAIYFCFVAPLGLLAMLALVQSLECAPRGVFGALLLGYSVFLAVIVTPGFLNSLGGKYAPDDQLSALTAPVAVGLRVSPEWSSEYNQLIPLVQSHLSGGALIAEPDCPEVYSMVGVPDPMKSSFEFFEPLKSFDQRIHQIASSGALRVIVVHDTPQFSHQYEEPLRSLINSSYEGIKLSEHFEVYWKR